MQSLLQKVSFYLCLRPMINEDKIIPSAADCINEFTHNVDKIVVRKMDMMRVRARGHGTQRNLGPSHTFP